MERTTAVVLNSTWSGASNDSAEVERPEKLSNSPEFHTYPRDDVVMRCADAPSLSSQDPEALGPSVRLMRQTALTETLASDIQIIAPLNPSDL